MKRLSLILIMAFCAIVFFNSCNSDREGTYTFLCSNNTAGIKSEERLAEILEVIETDSYFRSKLTITGKFSTACEQAAKEFRTHCDAIAPRIEELLDADEYYMESLVCADPFQTLLRCRWVSGKSGFEQE